MADNRLSVEVLWYRVIRANLSLRYRPDAVTARHLERPPPSTGTAPPLPPARPTPSSSGAAPSRTAGPGSVKMEPAIDPALMRRNLANDPGYIDAIKAWSRFRVVRAGWFSAQEAIEYID